MIPVNEPIFFGNEKKYLNECIDSGWISSDGPFVSLFEKKLATYFNRKFAIAVSNGTVAVDLAVESLNLKRGDVNSLTTAIKKGLLLKDSSETEDKCRNTILKTYTPKNQAQIIEFFLDSI
jgi:hypothetical protein